jgi:Zn ribbon nucleic-acid-binding protein
MYNLKCVGGISNKIFSDTLELINQLLPHCDETLPVNTYEVKKFLSDMGLGYEKIPACRNDCMLFWKDNKDLDSCIVCGESKWRVDTHLDEDGEVISSRKKRQVKVLRWSPLIPRLQRLFMSEHIAPYMRWHAEHSISGFYGRQ